MSYEEDQAARVALVEQVQQEALNMREYVAFLRVHKEVVPCDANYNLIVGYFNGDPLTVQALEESLPALRKFIALQDDAGGRLRIIKEIEELISKYSETARASVRAKLKWKSISELE